MGGTLRGAPQRVLPQPAVAPTRVIGMSAGCPHRRGPRARTPARVIGMSARCPHRRALLTPARVISPSRCQQPPHDVNDPLTVPTTRVRIDNAPSNSHPGRQRASTPKGEGTRTRAGRAADTADNARPHQGGTRAKAGHAADTIDVDTIDHARCPGARPHQGQTPGGLLRIAHHPPRSTHTRTPIYATRTAHKGLIPPLCAAQCCLIPSLVCDTEKRVKCAERGRPEGAAPGPSQTRPSGGRPRRSS